MMRRWILLLICSVTIGFAREALPDSVLVPAFRLELSDIEVTRLAQPLQYFDKIGRRAGLMGYESGSFEMWVWPWKALRNFELSFLLGTSTQPILARDVVRTVSVAPEATVITYSYESFTVREIAIVPLDEPGAVLLLDVHTTAPLTIVASFLPVMEPMWPAGIGGQFSYWDDVANAYVISEGRWRAIFLCGSPASEPMAAPPAHMFADAPLQFKISLSAGESAGHFIPLVIAGGQGMKMDSVKSIYKHLWTDAEGLYKRNQGYYRALRESTVQISTPVKEIDRAFEWGKIALDNLLVRNPALGTGLVAGFGLSGGSARPGFAWFFGGDAFINTLAFDSYGAFAAVREGLAFAQKWQRQEDFPIRKRPGTVNRDVGKMAHELSQSDGLVDWWNDYHYGYNHADTTPWYIVAMGDYLRSSGDADFIKKSWRSLKQAYQWCLSKDSDGDGLMDLKGAGLGALEFGKLVGIYADMYTCAVWTQAIREMTEMADVVGDHEMRKAAEPQLIRAQKALEQKFWMDDPGFYSYGATEKNEQVKEKTPWPATAMMFSLLDENRTVRSLEAYNGADLCTDWGTRSLPPSSAYFEPTNYNYGAVWPFLSTFLGTAQFRHHFGLSGYQTLCSVVRQAFTNGIGCVPEVFSGTLNQKLGEAYHHQGFSTTGYVVPLVRGLLGLEVDAVRGKILFAPHLPPDWDSIAVRNVRVGLMTVDLILKRTNGSMELRVRKEGPGVVELQFSPALPPGVREVKAVLDGTPADAELSLNSQDVHPTVRLSVSARSVAALEWNAVPEIVAPAIQTSPGATNYSLKVVSQNLEGDTLRLLVEGVSGEAYSLPVRNASRVASVTGAALDGDVIHVQIPGGRGGEFVKHQVQVVFK